MMLVMVSTEMITLPTLNCVSLSWPRIRCTIRASHPCSSIVSSVSCARLCMGPPGYP